MNPKTQNPLHKPVFPFHLNLRLYTSIRPYPLTHDIFWHYSPLSVAPLIAIKVPFLWFCFVKHTLLQVSKHEAHSKKKLNQQAINPKHSTFHFTIRHFDIQVIESINPSPSTNITALIDNSAYKFQLWTNPKLHEIQNPHRLLIFVKRDAVLLLHLGELVLLLLLIKLLAHLGLLIVENDEVPIGDVEAREMIDGGLGVIDVLVDNERGAASVLVGADSDLADGTVLAEDVVHLLT